MSIKPIALSLLLAGCAAEGTVTTTPATPKPGTAAATATTATVARAETPDAPFRQTPPPEDGPLVFQPPKIESFKLKSGMKVLLVERHDLPVVAVSVTMKYGTGDLALPTGAGTFAAQMLEQGTASRDAIQISDQYEEIGARHGVSAGGDSATSILAVLTRHLDRGLALMSDVLLHPTFPEAEVERLRTRKVTGLVAEKNIPEAIAQNALSAAVYGRQHPYGHGSGRPEDVKKLTREDLSKAWSALFTPKNAVIIVVGDATRASVTPLLERSFAGWKPGPGAIAPHAPPPVTAGGPRLVWVDKPGSAQSQIRVAIDLPVAESSPDRIPLSIMNAVLGGGLTARLSMNLRETHGFTYGANSGNQLRHGPGLFVASSGVQTQSTGPAIKEFFFELNRMRTEDIKPGELADAKEQVRRSTQTPFESLNGVLGALTTLVVTDRPLDDYSTVAKRIDAVTIADVRRVATKYLRTDAMKVIVVGDKSKLDQASIEPLKLGAPALHDEYGDPIK